MLDGDGHQSGTGATQPQHDGFRPLWRHAGVTVVLEALDIIRPFVGQHLELQVLTLQGVIDQGDDGTIGNQAQAALQRGQQLLHVTNTYHVVTSLVCFLVTSAGISIASRGGQVDDGLAACLVAFHQGHSDDQPVHIQPLDLVLHLAHAVDAPERAAVAFNPLSAPTSNGDLGLGTFADAALFLPLAALACTGHGGDIFGDDDAGGDSAAHPDR